MIYNDYSKELKDKLKSARPKPEQRVQFIALNNQAISIPGTALIYDPGKNEGAGDYINIANKVGVKEVKDEGSNKDSVSITRRVRLSKDLGYTQTIYGNRPDQLSLFDYLYLHPANQSNKGKKGYAPPIGGYKFKMKNPDADAQLELIKEENINIAKGIVFAMENQELLDHAQGLFPNTHQYLSPNQIKMKLLEMAKNDPDKIKGLSQDVDVSGIAFIKKLEEAKVIENKNKQWSYVENGDKIVGISPKVDSYKTLVNFLLKNEDVREYLKDELKKTIDN